MASKRPQTPERNIQRKRVLMSGTLFTPDGAQRVRVRDLTAVGAQLQLDSNVSPGSDAIFKRGTLFAAAHVAWTRDLCAGIRFYRPLPQFEWAECDPGSPVPSDNTQNMQLISSTEPFETISPVEAK